MRLRRRHADDQPTFPTWREELVERARHPRVRLFKALSIILLLGLVAAVGLQVAYLLSVRDNLLAGRAALLAARRSALGGDLKAASRSFATAADRFGAAVDFSNGPIGDAARIVPWLGNGAEATAIMADAGASLSSTGLLVVDALGETPGGIAAFAPRGGVFPIDRYAALAPTIDHAAGNVTDAAAELADAPDSLMPGTIATARWDAEADTTRLAEDLLGIGMLLRAAPEFGGSAAPQRYLVLSQNPAELRGTGGIWGAYAILTIRGGHVTVSSSRAIGTLRDFPAGRVQSPSAEYSRNYDQYGGAGSWQNMNATPDFPAAAQAALNNYAVGEGRRLNGVWAVDPFALRKLLAITGPVSVPGAGSITAANVVAFTTHRVYTAFGDTTQRKEIVGTVATNVLVRFLAMHQQPIPRLRAIGDVLASGHLRVYSTDPMMRSGLGALGLGGAFSEPDGDVLAVTVNNGSGSKIDYYADRTVTYDVRLGADGAAISETTVAIANEAPTHGQPRYVLGPSLHGGQAGDQVPVTTVSCHAPCALQTAERDGRPIEVAVGSENGIPWLRDYRAIGAGQTGSLRLAWSAEHVWSGNSSGGSYNLTVFGQTTIRPTHTQVVIHPPAGTHIVWTSEPMSIEGDQATWLSSSPGTTHLSVRFSAPLPLRIVRDLTRPIVGLR